MIIKIADILISIIIPPSLSRKIAIEFYQKLPSSRKPEVKIQLHYGQPQLSLEKKDYVIGLKGRELKGGGDIYRANGKYIFVCDPIVTDDNKKLSWRVMGRYKKGTPVWLKRTIKVKLPSTSKNNLLSEARRVAIFSSDFRKGDIYSGFSPSLKLPEGDSIFSIFLGGFPYDPLCECIIANLLSLNQGLLFHGCGVMDKRRGYLFLGYSGSGKSTMSQLWQNEAVVLSDERIGVRKINGCFYVYAVPWFGITAERVSANKGVPLEKIFFLQHGSKNKAVQYSYREAFQKLLNHFCCPVWNKKAMEETLESCTELAQKIPCFSLHFVPRKKVLGFIRGC